MRWPGGAYPIPEICRWLSSCPSTQASRKELVNYRLLSASGGSAFISDRNEHPVDIIGKRENIRVSAWRVSDATYYISIGWSFSNKYICAGRHFPVCACGDGSKRCSSQLQ